MHLAQNNRKAFLHVSFVVCFFFDLVVNLPEHVVTGNLSADVHFIIVFACTDTQRYTGQSVRSISIFLNIAFLVFGKFLPFVFKTQMNCRCQVVLNSITKLTAG